MNSGWMDDAHFAHCWSWSIIIVTVVLLKLLVILVMGYRARKL